MIGKQTEARSKRTAAHRFGEIIANGHFTLSLVHPLKYPDELGLTMREVWFITYVLMFKWDDGLPYPSLNKIRKKMKMAPATIHKIKQSLIDKGYLKIVNRNRVIDGKETNSKTSNAYDFEGLFRRIEELISEGYI